MKMQCVLLLLVLLVMACSTTAKVELDARPDTKVVEAVTEVVTPDVVVPREVLLDLPRTEETFGTEIAPEFVGPGCEAGEGCFLDPCAENSQCQSSWCVEHMGDGVCTQSCQDECPPGWSCKQVAGTDPDVVYVCASDYANLCKPCKDGNGCLSPSGVADVCVDYGEEGSFCGGACATDEDCPWGFSCLTTVTVDGIDTLQCVADAGVCPCTDKSVSLGLWTPCETAGEFGACEGKRVCTEGGLTPCDAGVPTEETCNGVDDDCDGSVDEPTESGGNFINLCDDGNECTEDTCEGVDGCQSSALEGTECKDGDICTVADHCIAGECSGDPVICDDDNPCTDNACTENGGCEYAPNLADCDDGDPCTVADECNAGLCAGTQISCECDVDADCLELEDGDLCSGTLVCNTEVLPHQCSTDLATVVECPEPEGVDAICLAAACDGLSGECSLVPAHEALACEDGDPCTIGDTCQTGICAAGTSLNCNDGNLCTDDACEAGEGCAYSHNEAACDDGDLCTLGDVCSFGECEAGEGTLACDDGNVCTTDSCVPGVGCGHVAQDGACDDGDACTVGDHCAGGLCVFDGLAQCDDGNVCTDDLCLPGEGCQYTANEVPCDDGNSCTIGDQCKNGNCEPTGQLPCDDGNLCTVDSCDPVLGCEHAGNDNPCDDQNPCTVNDQCKGGVCVAGDAAVCDDANICTNDSCDPATGCEYGLNVSPCNDDNLCTVDDHCHLGDCIGGGDLVCDDGSVCTDDSCQPASGCKFEVVVEPCCSGGTEACGDVCVNTAFNPAHCGDCFEPCGPAEVCVDGDCKSDCAEGQTKCGLACTNTDFDPDNCGDCEEVCVGADNAAGICVGGECTELCLAGYSDCNLDMELDGCEVNLLTDPLHCGFCGDACGEVTHGTKACEDGGCVIEGCDGTWLNCDGMYNTGCEVDTKTNGSHCGECNNDCGQGFACIDSECVEMSTSFIVMAEKDITFNGVNYLLLKVGFSSFQSQSANWCYEYRDLCNSYGLDPTGCGKNWNSSFYKVCRDTYGSKTYDNSLSCNPSGPISQAAKDNGFNDAHTWNSFGYHYCNETCAKTLCSGTGCHTALSYIDATQSHGYTLCIK